MAVVITEKLKAELRQRFPTLDQLREDITNEMNERKRMLYVINQDRFAKAWRQKEDADEHDFIVSSVCQMKRDVVKRWMEQRVVPEIKSMSRRKREALAKKNHIKNYKKLSDEQLNEQLKKWGYIWVV